MGPCSREGVHEGHPSSYLVENLLGSAGVSAETSGTETILSFVSDVDRMFFVVCLDKSKDGAKELLVVWLL